MSRARFLLNFIRSPRQVGSLTPSSRWLCRHLLRAADFSGSRCIVEYGPGTACLTKMILDILPPAATLLAFEINKEFIRLIEKDCTHPRLLLIDDSAERVETYLKEYGFRGADYIFSGIPFSTIPAAVRMGILTATNRALAPDGLFIAYQYSLYILRALRSVFGNVGVSFEPRNIPPAFCFVCSKKA